MTNPLGQANSTVMTIHVNIGEAKTRFSELCAAALRGEDVIVQNAGVPKLRLVPIEDEALLRRTASAAKRAAAIGFAREKYAHLPPEMFDVPRRMTDEELNDRDNRKFGAASS